MNPDSNNTATYSSGTSCASCVHVEIMEQPKPGGYRFRYKNEGRSTTITGVNSSKNCKTYPTIKIHGYQGQVHLLISLVSLNGPPYYPHPYKLVGKSCTDGVYYRYITNTEKTISFSDLAIQCVKKNDIQESLDKRKELNVDPYRTGFSHATDIKSINFNGVRLCFQVILIESSDKCCHPAVSTPIYDKKVVPAIARLSHHSAPVTGGQKVILLCDSDIEDDTEIVFYEEKDGKRIWSSTGIFSRDDIHYKTAILFQTPPYENLNVEDDVKCFICLRQPSTGIESNSFEFTLSPEKFILSPNRERRLDAING